MRAPNHCEGRRKVPTMSQVLCSIQYICFRKTLVLNMGVPNLPWAPSSRVTHLLPQPPMAHTKVSWVKKWEISTQRWKCSIKPLFDAAQDSVHYRIEVYAVVHFYAILFYWVKSWWNLPYGQFIRHTFAVLCRLIGRGSSTTRSTSVLLSWSGWSLAHWTKSAAESWQTWKSPVSFAYYLPIDQPYGAQSADPVA